MKKIFSAALAALIMISLAACSRGGDSRIRDLDDLAGKTVGVLRGTSSEGYLRHFEYDVEVREYDDTDALKKALRNGQVDCAVAEEEKAGEMTGFLSGLETLEEPFTDSDYVIAVSAENRIMVENLNIALSGIDRSGELDRLTSGTGGVITPAEDTGTAVTVAVDATFYPYAYYDGEGDLTGIEIDLVRAICKYLGLSPEFLPVETDMLLYMAESGKCSFAVGRITADPADEGLAFTSPYLHSTQLIVVRK